MNKIETEENRARLIKANEYLIRRSEYHNQHTGDPIQGEQLAKIRAQRLEKLSTKSILELYDDYFRDTYRKHIEWNMNGGAEV